MSKVKQFFTLEQIMIGILLALASIGFTKAYAQNAGKEDGFFSAGINWNTGGLSSSPVTGYEQKKSPGFGFRIGAQVWQPGLYAVGGIDMGSRDIRLLGRNQGEVESTTFVGGLMWRWNEGEMIQPYILGGLQYTTFDGSLGAGTMRIKENGKFGASLGAGIHVNMTGVLEGAVDFLDVGVKHHAYGKSTLETVGGAKVTDFKFGGTIFSVGVGKKF